MEYGLLLMASEVLSTAKKESSLLELDLYIKDQKNLHPLVVNFELDFITVALEVCGKMLPVKPLHS